MSRSLDLPATEGVDTLAQEVAKLQNKGKRRIAFLGSRHVPVVDIHLIELIARSLAEEGHSILTWPKACSIISTEARVSNSTFKIGTSNSSAL